MSNVRRILVINPGSTSTKVAIFENESLLFSQTLALSRETVAQFKTILSQLDFRIDTVKRCLEKAGYRDMKFDAVVGRGGNMYPVVGGTYEVSDLMCEHLRLGPLGQHPSNLGGLIARSLADPAGIPAYVVDPVIVDEFEALARYSGSPEFWRKSKDHPLNQKAVGRKAAKDMGSSYDKLNFIIVHLGGGISVGTHRQGRLIDVNDSLDGDGPFSPERAGSVPVGEVIGMCMSGKYTEKEIRKKFSGQGGLVAYLGTNDTREVVRRIKAGDERAKEVYEAMAYQVSKEIGASATVLNGKVDAILLTGGIAYDELFTSWVRERVGFIAPVKVYPGEFEMEALALGAIRVLRGEEQVQIYDPKSVSGTIY